MMMMMMMMMIGHFLFTCLDTFAIGRIV